MSKTLHEMLDEVSSSKKKKLNPKIIRIGDTVKIINPEIVIRVGYPMSIEDAKKEIKELYHDEIVLFLDKTIYKQSDQRDSKYKTIFRITNYDELKIYNKIVSAMAYIHLQSKGFGGKEKKIHSEIRQDLLGITSKVRQIFIRKTGTYFPSSGGYNSYDGEYDYEPGGLANEKTHKILQLSHWVNNEMVQMWSEENYIKIEACNVEKIFE